MSSLLGKSSKTKTSSSSVSTVKTAPRSADELALLKQQLSVANSQLRSIGRLGSFTDQQFNAFLPTLAREVNKFLPQEQRITSQSLGIAQDQLGHSTELNNTALQQIRNGVKLTPDQEALITSSANSAIQSGLSDISKYRDESLRSLAQETAIGRGLRPEDTPILDVGGRVINESSRQAANLVTGIRGQEAQQKLQYPIDAGNYVAGLTQAQQTQTANTANFVQQLRQQAFNNRLNLTSTTGTLGINKAQIGANANVLPTLAAESMANSTTRTEGTNVAKGSSFDPMDIIAKAAGAAGGASVGAADTGLSLFGP